MDLEFIRFEHFTSKKSYCHLQSHFAAHDMSYPVFEKRKEPFTDFKIIDYEIDEFENQIKKEVYFINDYVIPGLKEIHHRYFLNFRRSVHDKSLYTSELLEAYAKRYFDKINQVEKEIYKVDFINVVIKRIVIQKLGELNDLIEDFVKNPYKHIDERIKFNWSRTDIIYFFHLLKLNETIAPIANSDLGRIIDACFEYYDKKEQSYKPIHSSRKHLSDFNRISRSDIDSNQRLKKLLQHDDFYSH